LNRASLATSGREKNAQSLEDDDVTLLVLHHNGGPPKKISLGEKLDVYAKVFALKKV
jgi:hypothetical protein